MRNLERRLAALFRKAATQIAKGEADKVRIDEARAREWLGPRRFSGEVRKRTSEPGVATGLAWTPVGGEVLFIEAGAYAGRGPAEADGPALRGDAGVGAGGVLVGALARRRARPRPGLVRAHDVHIHVPAGAVPKDGPSAGVAMATAIVSLVTGKPVAEDVGMTGEVTLTGQVLPIGGVREKVLAAQRARLKRVILPRENEPDLDELPPETREARVRARGRALRRARGGARRAATRVARAQTERAAERRRRPPSRAPARRRRSGTSSLVLAATSWNARRSSSASTILPSRS